GAFPLIARLLVDRMSPKERAAAQGTMWMSTRAGGALAPFVVVALIPRLGSWEPTLVVLGLIGIVWAACFAGAYRDPVHHAARASHAATPLRRLLTNRNVLIIYGIYGCGGFAANFFISLLPTYLETTRQLDKN